MHKNYFCGLRFKLSQTFTKMHFWLPWTWNRFENFEKRLKFGLNWKVVNCWIVVIVHTIINIQAIVFIVSKILMKIINLLKYILTELNLN